MRGRAVRDTAALRAVGPASFCTSEALEFLTQEAYGFLVCCLVSWQAFPMGPDDLSPACSLMHRADLSVAWEGYVLAAPGSSLEKHRKMSNDQLLSFK